MSQLLHPCQQACGGGVESSESLSSSMLRALPVGSQHARRVTEAVRGWSLGGDWGVQYYTDFRTLWNALEKLKFKEIYQLKVPIFTLKIFKSSNIFSSLYIMIVVASIIYCYVTT